MTPTPRTDVEQKHAEAMYDLHCEAGDQYFDPSAYSFARQLEIELTEATRQRDEYRSIARELAYLVNNPYYNCMEGEGCISGCVAEWEQDREHELQSLEKLEANQQ